MSNKFMFLLLASMIFCMIISVGCISPGTDNLSYTPKEPLFRAYYDISLDEVERPAKAKTRYGEQKLSKMKDGEVYKYSFEDDMVKILWLATTENVTFVLENKTNHSLKIIWDDASFVDTSGINHRVMHTGVKYTDRNNPQPPSLDSHVSFLS